MVSSERVLLATRLSTAMRTTSHGAATPVDPSTSGVSATSPTDAEIAAGAWVEYVKALIDEPLRRVPDEAGGGLSRTQYLPAGCRL